MKYGLLKFTSYKPNIGDYMQLAGIVKAYKRLGIKEEDIVEIERDHLSAYDGEYVILPMTAAFNATSAVRFFPLSKKILPIFIGFFTGDESIAVEIAKYEKFGPFGCRDLVTMNLMRKQGVQAYMSGCYSIGFEKRSSEPENGKVYLCDPPEGLIKYIPTDYMENSITLPKPHRTMKSSGYNQENEQAAKEYVTGLIGELKKNAKLVITRRLHMALPCIAMGIPVILAHECDTGVVEECRFSGLDRIVKVYKPSEYSLIDWNPGVPDIEWLKEQTIQLAINRIKDMEKHWGNLCELSHYYESTEHQVYYNGMKATYLSEFQKRYYLNNAWKMERTIFEYIVHKKFEKMHLIFYGAGDKGMWAVRRYKDYIERAAEFHIVDGDVNKQGKGLNDILRGQDWNIDIPNNYIIENPKMIKSIDKNKLVVVVSCNRYYSGNGAEIGNMLMKDYGLREEQELYFLDKLNNSMEMHLSSTSKPVYFLSGF